MSVRTHQAGFARTIIIHCNGNLSDDDTDGNGASNYLDADRDNDGIRDEREVGLVPSFPYDADWDGTPEDDSTKRDLSH